jgi:hypothetical protein
MQTQLQKQSIAVSRNEKIDLLLTMPLYTFQGVHLLTEPTLKGGKKTLSLFGGKVFKLARYVFAKRDYNTAIINKGEKLGLNIEDWKIQPHNYATHIKGNILCHNEDLTMDIYNSEKRLYAQFMLHKGSVLEAQYFNADMIEITKDEIAPYLIEKTISKKQSDFGFTQSDYIPVINPKLDSIVRFTANNCEYISE